MAGSSVQASGFRREQPVQPGFQVASLDGAQEQAQDRPPRRQRRRAEPVTTCKVDPLVMAVALDMADGDPSRLRIISVSTVEVQTSRGTVPVERKPQQAP